MTEALSRRATRAAADTAIAEFRALFALVLAAEAIVGVLVLLTPGWVLGLVGLEGGEAARLFGVVLVGFAVLQSPALLVPDVERLPVVIGLPVRGLCAVVAVLLGGALFWVGVVELLATVTVYLSFRRMIIAVLSSRP